MSTMTKKNTFNIEDRFFPCYLNMGTVREAVSFGWKDFYSKDFSTPNPEIEDELVGHLKTNSQLVEMFDDDKLREIASIYLKYAEFIQSLHVWAGNLFSALDSGNGIDIDKAVEYSSKWEDTLFEVYEKYRISQSMFDRILYDMILTDLLWNTRFDPRDPRIQDINKKRISIIRDKDHLDMEDMNQQASLEESVTNIFGKVKSTINKYKIDIDDEGNILIKRNFRADLFKYYKNALRLMRMYKSQDKVDELKAELAKIFFINEIIEAKYLHNDRLTKEEKNEYKKYMDLRANILSSFKQYMDYVLVKEVEFDFNTYYENSPYAKALTLDRERLKGIRNLIKILITGK